MSSVPRGTLGAVCKKLAKSRNVPRGTLASGRLTPQVPGVSGLSFPLQTSLSLKTVLDLAKVAASDHYYNLDSSIF